MRQKHVRLLGYEPSFGDISLTRLSTSIVWSSPRSSMPAAHFLSEFPRRFSAVLTWRVVPGHWQGAYLVLRAHPSSRAWENEIVRIWAAKLSGLTGSKSQQGTRTERIFRNRVLPASPLSDPLFADKKRRKHTQSSGTATS